MQTWDEVELVVEGGLSYDFPAMYKVEQRWNDPKLSDIGQALEQQLAVSEGFQNIKPGMKIAIAVGSRGIDQLATVLKQLVAQLKQKGASPFLFPAMGSHGGGKADHQKEILHAYGITEASIGAPIYSSMEVIEIGRLSNGTPLYCDKLAYESDGIIVVNRVKPHTSFRGELESGLTKMMVIGIGKHKGATAFHQGGFAKLGPQLLEAAPIFLEKAPILMGVAMLENAYDQLTLLGIVEKKGWVDEEKALLAKAKSLMPSLPLDDIDVLIVDVMGKNISGAGMDPNIINRAGSAAFVPAPTPQINKLVVLDITEESGGNAIGVGVADITTRKLVDKINLSDMYANAITATVLAGSRIPVTVKNDREAIAVAMRTSNAVGPIKIVRIKSTLELSSLWVSEGCLPQIKESPRTRVMDKMDLSFDKWGNLIP